MSIQETLLSTTVGAAINFIFNELQVLLKEMRSRSIENEAPLPSKKEQHVDLAKKKDIVEWALKAKIDSQTEAEIRGLIEIIEIHKQNRLRSQKIIAKMGGEVFASPPQLAALNEAEESIQKLSTELIRKVEKLYGSKVLTDKEN